MDLIQADLIQMDLIQIDLIQIDFIQMDIIQIELIQIDLIQTNLILSFDSKGFWLLFDSISVDNEHLPALVFKPFRKRKDIYRR